MGCCVGGLQLESVLQRTLRQGGRVTRQSKQAQVSQDTSVCSSNVCVCVCVAGDGEETGGGAERDRVSQNDPAKSPRLPQVTQSQLKLSPFHSLTSSIN